MYRVKKRDGSLVAFDIAKISCAIKAAFDATNTPYTQEILDMLSLRVTGEYAPLIKDGIVSVEAIQDSVEVVLIQCNYVQVAKAYILYRKQHESIREVAATVINYKDTMDNYLKINDWRVKENSTVTYSVGGLILNNSGALTANYWLSEVYDEEIAAAHRNADFHIHDLSMLTGYCAGWSLRQLIEQGLGG
ncbi:MAG: ribonucleoside triphosphate reductase, partial [Clostridia bacterium]|nr:ribonucleoside triphosphate reductase [Clostridia bacterium]